MSTNYGSFRIQLSYKLTLTHLHAFNNKHTKYVLVCTYVCQHILNSAARELMCQFANILTAFPKYTHTKLVRINIRDVVYFLKQKNSF